MSKVDLFFRSIKKYNYLFFILVGYVLFLGIYENYLGLFLFFIIGAFLYTFSKKKILVLFIAILLSFGLSAVNKCIEEGFEDEDAKDEDEGFEKDEGFEEEKEKEDDKPVVIDTNKPMDQLSDKEIKKIQEEVNR